MIVAGLRLRKVSLDTPGATAPDGGGGYVEGWVPLEPAVAWARITPATQVDMERSAAGTTITAQTHLIEMTYHRGVTTKTRIQYRDPDRGVRTFQITSVRNPEEARRELLIVAEELHA